MKDIQAYRAKYKAWKAAQRPTCGARTRTGKPCLMRPLLNGRCRFHGGLSTGAKTKAGREAIAQAQKKRWKRWHKEQARLAKVEQL